MSQINIPMLVNARSTALTPYDTSFFSFSINNPVDIMQKISTLAFVSHD